MKMLKKEAEQRQAVEMLCTDMLVPKGHLLRKIDVAVNFARIYDLVEDLYCEDNGRPSCDPVVLFKLVLIQHLFGIRSLRQTMRDAEVNVAYRWFLGYTMSQQLPHFATISYAFRHRFTAEVIEGVFRWILEEVARAGYLSAEVVFVDGTHIKANANLKKQVKKAIPVAAKRYQEQLDEEIEADRAAHGKKPLKKDDDDDGLSAPGKQKIVAESTTDPESGVFHKGEHKKCFAYEAHTACDRRGYILETEITPGNVHDSVAFDTVFERLKAHYPEVQFVTADAGYKTPWICKQIFDSGKIPSLPYKRPMTKKGNLPWNAYVYDEYYDCILCPQNQVLSYATTNREGYKEYKSKGYIFPDCPELEKCTQNRQHTKTVTRHIWQEYLERAEDIRHSPAGKATYALRSQTIERVFADAKEKHAMRYTPYRGLAAVTAWVKLKFAAMNLKKLALHKWRLFLLFYLHLLQEATSLRCKVASLTACGPGPKGPGPSDRRQRGCFLLEAAPKRIRQDGKKRTKRPGDAFHVLYGGGEEGLLVHVADSEHARMAQAMQLFGFCEGSFNGFLAPGVDAFPTACLLKRVRLFQCILPYMARHLPSAGFGREAFRPFGAVPACFGLAPVLPIAFPVGRAPCQLVPLRTQVNVFDWIIGETVFSEIVPPCAYASDTLLPAVSRLPQAGGIPARCGIPHPAPCTSAASPAAYQYPLVSLLWVLRR